MCTTMQTENVYKIDMWYNDEFVSQNFHIVEIFTMTQATRSGIMALTTAFG